MSEELQHEAVTRWAKAKYKLHDEAVVKVEQVTVSGGYCETCWYEEEEWHVLLKEDNSWRRIDNFYDDYASIVREILDFSITGKIKET